MNRLLRFLFYAVLVRTIVKIVLGLNVRHLNRLPKEGPAVIVANHNSHLDTMVLMSLFPLKLLPIINPVAAKDYFFRNKLLGWFALNIIGILPINRSSEKKMEDPLLPCYQALSNGKILIFFPEGSRGEPELLSKYKMGIAKISEKYPDLPIIPVLLHGLGKALPKGEGMLVPFFCDVFIGDTIYWQGERIKLIETIENTMKQLSTEGQFPSWD